jgi:hypothetical protein
MKSIFIEQSIGAESVMMGSVVEKDGAFCTNIHKGGQADVINPTHMLCDVLSPIPI